VYRIGGLGTAGGLALLALIVKAAADGAFGIIVLGAVPVLYVLVLAALRGSSQVVVGHGYVRVRSGFRTWTYRRGDGTVAVRIRTTGVLVPAKAGVLYLLQDGVRTAVRLSPQAQRRVLDILQVKPFDVEQTRYGLGPVPPELKRAVPYWLRNGFAMGILIAAGLLAVVIVVTAIAKH
jgi:hypothetical protein